MDVHAHLVGLGWQGRGHALGRHKNGIKAPILVSHKYNQLGLGAKEKKEKQADQWWLKAFDATLQDLGTGKVVCSGSSFIRKLTFSNIFGVSQLYPTSNHPAAYKAGCMASL